MMNQSYLTKMNEIKRNLQPIIMLSLDSDTNRALSIKSYEPRLGPEGLDRSFSSLVECKDEFSIRFKSYIMKKVKLFIRYCMLDKEKTDQLDIRFDSFFVEYNYSHLFEWSQKKITSYK